MASVERLKELVGAETRVRVFSAASPTMLMGEGKVIAVCEAPSFLVQAADGSTSCHSSALPVEVETWQRLDR